MDGCPHLVVPLTLAAGSEVKRYIFIDSGGASFSAWRIEQMQRAEVPSDTRTLEVLLARLAR